jgi:hypothetical protein
VRKIVLILGVVVASLGLSACGTTTKATIDTSIASLGAQSDLQIHITGSVSGAGTAEARKVLNVLSLETHYANPSGAPLSQSESKPNVELSVNVGDKVLVDVRGVGSNVYLKFNLSAVNDIPGLPLTSTDQTELGALQLFLGGKWFEIPSSLIKSELPASAAAKANAAQESAIQRKVFDALSKLIDNGHAAALSSGGYSETGTLASVVKALRPIVLSVDPSASAIGLTVAGTYTLTLTNAGSVATGGSISITSPEGKSGTGNATVSLKAALTHDSDPIVKPKNVTVITPALIQQLLGSTSSL